MNEKLSIDLNSPASPSAIITALWVGEKAPDAFSWAIQAFLAFKTRRSTNFSHNAFIFHATGKIWHATFPGGVREEDASTFLGSHSLVRYSKTLVLDCSVDTFTSFLESERGKSYSHTQNIAHFLPMFFRRFFRNGDRQRNCSEFLAKACAYAKDLSQNFDGCIDFILPTDTYAVLQPVPVPVPMRDDER